MSALEEAARRGAAAWPELTVPAQVFEAWLRARAEDDVGRLEVEDLFLACACAQGNERAIRAFHERFDPEIGVALHRLGVTADAAKDVRQAVVSKLFLGDAPKIASYSGRGSLAHWVRAVAAREALGVRRTAARRDRLLDAAGDLAPEDPELGFLKQRYRGEFREAFGRALAGLSDEDRVVLRHRFVDELTLDQLAAACGVHRATAARWLSRIRNDLLDATRGELQARLRVDRSEFDSILRLIQSKFDVSVRRLLR
jgi:RNA polymerase sigma-70 factor (ECF subfamily)